MPLQFIFHASSLTFLVFPGQPSSLVLSSLPYWPLVWRSSLSFADFPALCLQRIPHYVDRLQQNGLFCSSNSLVDPFPCLVWLRGFKQIECVSSLALPLWPLLAVWQRAAARDARDHHVLIKWTKRMRCLYK